MLRYWVLAILMALIGCAKRAYEAAPETGYYEDYDANYGGYAGESAAYDAPSMAMDAAPAPSAPGVQAARKSSGASTRATTSSATGAQGPPDEPAGPRMVHYNGYIQLKVTDGEALVEQVAKRAEALGGYVEQRSLTRITVRVPVGSFLDTFKEVLSYGEVVDKSLTAEDVTDAFLDVELRLRTANTTRARLQELLAKATTEEEKLELLRQIARLTEQIDVMEAQLRTLQALADFSRLTVEAQAREPFMARQGAPEIEGFGFIQQLSPFQRDVSFTGKKLELAVPDGMVALDVRKRFAVESADGAAMWTTRLENQPIGDSAFWVEALRTRLAPEFGAAEVKAVGGFQVLRLVEPGSDTPYVYIVGVRAEGKHLDLVEIYYPSTAHEDRYKAAVDAALSGGGQS